MLSYNTNFLWLQSAPASTHPHRMGVCRAAVLARDDWQLTARHSDANAHLCAAIATPLPLKETLGHQVSVTPRSPFNFYRLAALLRR